MAKKNIQTQIISYVAIGLSVLALMVSVIEVLFLRDEVKAQAWPFLQISSLYSEKGYTLAVENKGVGPAKIDSMTLFLDENTVNDLDTAIIETLGKEHAFSYDLYKANNPSPGVMSANERINLFHVPWQNNTRTLSKAWSTRFSVSMCYCSIFDDCWVAELDSGVPREVASCDV